MTAVICILSPFSIPIGPVPVTLGVFVLFLTVCLLGTTDAVIACLIYMLLGFAGLPVFSGFTAGPGKLLGPTGGYMIGYLPMIVIAGLVLDHTENLFLRFLGMLAGLLTGCYLPGTIWLSHLAGMTFRAALDVAVLPFVIPDLMKIAAALLLGREIWRRLPKTEAGPG